MAIIGIAKAGIAHRVVLIGFIVVASRGMGRGGGSDALVSVLVQHSQDVLSSRFTHGDTFAHVANGSVLEQCGEHHDKASAQEDVDRFDI